MSNEEFWERLGQRIAFYHYILEESTKEGYFFTENQKKLENSQHYQKKLINFLRRKNFYDKYYFLI